MHKTYKDVTQLLASFDEVAITAVGKVEALGNICRNKG